MAVVGAAPGAPAPATSRRALRRAGAPAAAAPAPRTWWSWPLALVVALVHAALAISRYEHVTYSSWDLSIFTQGVDGYAHGHLPVSTVRGGAGFDLLGDHFSPALAVLAPGYRLFATPVYLLVVQAACFGASTVPVGRLAARTWGRARAGAAVALAYGLSWPLVSATAVDFHEVALAVPLLAWGCAALAERRWRAAAAWLAPLVLVKEDLGLTVAVAGVCALLAGARRLGAVLAVSGAAATAVELFVLIPLASSTHAYGYFDQVAGEGSGTAGGGSLLSAVSAGWDVKATTLLMLLGATAFVALRSPLALLAVPTLAWRFTSTNSSHWGHAWHYDAVLAPILFTAMVDAAARWRRAPASGFGARLAPAVPALALVIALAAVPTTPLGALLHAGAYRDSATAADARRVLARIPRGASVTSDIGLMSHLVADHPLTFVGTPVTRSTPAPDYVVIDPTAGWSQPMSGASAVDWADSAYPRQRYALAADDGSFILLRRTGAPS